MTTFNITDYKSDEMKQANIIYSVNKIQYKSEEFIYIDGNSDFGDTATARGWSGSGVLGDPYLISNIQIIDPVLNPCIAIKNTDVFFVINNSYFHGSEYTGINLENVTNGVISKNIINETAHEGISLSMSDHNLIEYNEITHCGPPYAQSYHLDAGIVLKGSFPAKKGPTNNSIIGNNISHTSGAGIDLQYYCTNNTVSNNTIFMCTFSISMTDYTKYTNITYNIFTQNSGFYIEGKSFNNTIKWNDFFSNGPTSDFCPDATHQACDTGGNNTFSNNFWNEWYDPDNQEPLGIVDFPYEIDGTANNEDSFPLTEPFNYKVDHIFTGPKIIFPNGGETLNGTVKIQWVEAIDSWYHFMTYKLFYSNDSGSSWSDSNLVSYCDFVDMDTTGLLDGTNYLLKIVANASCGETAEDVSDGTFTIKNTKPTTTTTDKVSPGFSLVILLLSVTIIRIRKKMNQESKN